MGGISFGQPSSEFQICEALRDKEEWPNEPESAFVNGHEKTPPNLLRNIKRRESEVSYGS